MRRIYAQLTRCPVSKVYNWPDADVPLVAWICLDLLTDDVIRHPLPHFLIYTVIILKGGQERKDRDKTMSKKVKLMK
jgi:hypothetical protein